MQFANDMLGTGDTRAFYIFSGLPAPHYWDIFMHRVIIRASFGRRIKDIDSRRLTVMGITVFSIIWGGLPFNQQFSRGLCGN